MSKIPFPVIEILGKASQQIPAGQGCPLYLSPVQAGWPSAAEDYIDGQINLHEIAVRNQAATFFARAAGDSMIGMGIHDGDLLVVDRSAEAQNGSVVIATLDGEMLVKRLTRKNGKTWLASANPEYPEFEITNREHVHIWGVVTYVLHKL